MPGILPKLIVVRGGSSQTRIAQACDRCRSKKIRCDGIRPCCSQCANVGFECKTSDKLSRRAFPRGYTESLEERVRCLEREVRELKEHLDLKDEQLDMLSRLHSFGSYSPPASSTTSCSSMHKSVSGPPSVATPATSSPEATTDCAVSPHHHPPLPEGRELSPVGSSSEVSVSGRSGEESFGHLASQTNNNAQMANLARARNIAQENVTHPPSHVTNRGRHSISYDGPVNSGGWQWQQERNTDASTEEWERMLAMIDASHAAHIYGDAGLAHSALRHHPGFEGRPGAAGGRTTMRDGFDDPPTFDGLAETGGHHRGFPGDVLDGPASVMVDDGWSL